ncbi:MAG: YeeE/YedE family protein [Acidobacteria bacterium]|nr:YeeE/YedE family protein [Acidobacteriota bacterium]
MSSYVASGFSRTKGNEEQTNHQGERARGVVRVTAVHMGVIAGILAVAAEAFFEVRPPEAYGVCMACHGRDLVNWTINTLAATALPVAPASLVYPLLTTIGVFAGGLIAARRHGEFRWVLPDHPAKTFLYGALVMNFALVAGGCAIRLTLRTAAGEPLGAAGFGAMAAGIVLGTRWLRWRATR